MKNILKIFFCLVLSVLVFSPFTTATYEPRDCQEEEEQPTPTPEPTPTPLPPKEPDSFSPAQAGPAPKCSDPEPAVMPWNCNLYRYPTRAELFWVPGDGAIVDVLYKENHVAGWAHSLYGISNTGRATINNLVPRESYTFTVVSRNSCSGGKPVSCVIVDDPAGFFRTSYWLTW